MHLRSEVKLRTNKITKENFYLFVNTLLTGKEFIKKKKFWVLQNVEMADSLWIVKHNLKIWWSEGKLRFHPCRVNRPRETRHSSPVNKTKAGVNLRAPPTFQPTLDLIGQQQTVNFRKQSYPAFTDDRLPPA